MFSILDIAPDGACTIPFVSPGVQSLLGYTPEEYIALGCVLRSCARQLAAPGASRSSRRVQQHLLGFRAVARCL